jgi:regulatory protein
VVGSLAGGELPGGVTAGERLVDPEVRLQHARDLAWAALNRRDHTQAEIQRVLERKRCGPEEIGTVLSELAEGGWVDDAAYARRYAEDRRALDGWGAERIARRLRAVGIDRHHIEAALDAQPAEEERDAALALLRRRFPVAPEDARDRNRALGVLVRKGYELELSLDVLRAYCSVGEFD